MVEISALLLLYSLDIFFKLSAKWVYPILLTEFGSISNIKLKSDGLV